MTTHDYDIGIIGGGAAGLTVASGSAQLGARVEFGEPAFTDEHSVRLNGRSVSAKTWVVASGSSPGRPPIEGLEETPHLTNKEIFSLDRLPESMIILGAGPIATEMAQAFCRLGAMTGALRTGRAWEGSKCFWTGMKNPSGFRSWGRFNHPRQQPPGC